MNKHEIKQIGYGIIIGLIVIITFQHFIYGQTDIDYNIFYQLGLKENIYKWCAEIEGYLATCFDEKGGEWFSVYPVNYLNNTLFPDFDAFNHAQECMSLTEKKKYRICFQAERE